MSNVKHIPIKEFRELGFLQEANRQFFHPHGLALEVTIVGEEGWSVDNPIVKELAVKIAQAQAPDGRYVMDGTVRPVDAAKAFLDVYHPPGSVFISGVWDYRDDPEGVVFGDGHEGKAEKALNVVNQRAQHQEARQALFGTDSDVEPVDWVWTKEESGGA